jgi:predicted acylesterase/phospholipase RssA
VIWALLAAALAVAVVVVVALPFLREPAPASDALHELDRAERRLLEAEEARDRALAALQELEADHRAGQISDEDYRAVVGSLRRDAAEALRALDRLSPRGAGTSDAEAKID